jgi:hypothetical protein
MPELTLYTGPQAYDDVYEANDAFITNATSVIVGNFSGDVYDIGLRFDNVTVPQGAIINSATLTLTASTDESDPSTATVLKGIDEDDTAVYSSSSRPSQRPKTSATVSYDIPATTKNVEYDFPEIKTLVQEIVDRAGWASGKALGLVIEDNGNPSGDLKRFWAYDAGSSYPKLVITYTPVVEAGAQLDATVSVNASAIASVVSGTTLSATSVISLDAEVDDLQPASETRDRPRLHPAYLVEIKLKGGGPTLYLSDRNISTTARMYQDYIGDISGLTDMMSRSSSEVSNFEVVLSFKNDRYGDHEFLVELGDTYPFEGAECIIRDAHLGDDFTLSSVGEVIFRGVLEGPHDVDLMDFKCRALGMEHRADSSWKQESVETGSWPDAWEDLGRPEPIVYGSDILLPALRTDWGARTTLQADIDSSATSCYISDGSRFPEGNFSVWIDGERMLAGTRTGNTLNGLTRGYGGTDATSHKTGAACVEHKGQYRSLLASHELHSIGNVFAEVDGRLLRVTSGVTDTVENGRHVLTATEHITIDTVDIKKTYPPSERTLKRRASDIPVQQRTFNATGGYEPIIVSLPSAPEGTLENIMTRITWNVKVKENPTADIHIHTGPTGSDPKVCTIKSDGTVHSYLSSVFERKEASWVSSRTLYYTTSSSTGADKVLFTITEAEELADVTSEFSGDPSGGMKTLSTTTGLPVQKNSFSSGGYYAAATLNFPAAPSGTLTEVRTKISFTLRTVEAPLAEITFYTGPSNAYPRICTVKSDGTVINYMSSCEVAESSWQSSKTIYYSAASSVGADKVVFSVDAGEQSTRTSTESSVVSAENISTHSVSRFNAVANGFKDPDGSYGGLGSLIERPDYVIKHFIVEMLGFKPWDINTDSFDAAGSAYASAISTGYKFAFAVTEGITPSGFLRQLALECRSTLINRAGQWHLDFVPDSAPPAVKTISRGELAGEFAKFRFGKAHDISNYLSARFKRDYSGVERASKWLGTAAKSDSESQAKYGLYPMDLEFEAVRSQAMADDILEHMLLERKSPLLTVEFPVFFEHFDLRVGDTIEIDNPLYGGTKFYIEEIRRLDKFRATVRAVEWWV